VFWVARFVALTTFLNVRGIKWTARTSQVLTAAMFLVIGIFVVEAVQYVWLKQGWAGLISTKPFYNPATFDLRAIGMATSLAALTYIGLDGITTLAEDVKEPKRTVPLAIVLVCLLIGLCVLAQVYLAQRAWTDYTAFKEPDTEFYDVCSLVGGRCRPQAQRRHRHSRAGSGVPVLPVDLAQPPCPRQSRWRCVVSAGPALHRHHDPRVLHPV